MKKSFFAAIVMILAMLGVAACNQKGDKKIYNFNPCCENKNSVTFTRADDSPAGLIIWDESQNKNLLSFDITCQGTATCSVYEMTFHADQTILMYFPAFWVEDENHNQLTEVVYPSFGPDIQILFTSNLEVSGTKRVYLVGSLAWAASPGQGSLNSFQPVLAEADASDSVLGLPLTGDSLYAEYKGEDTFYTVLSPNSPSGTIAPGDNVTLMSFLVFTGEYNMEVNQLTYWFPGFDGSLSPCILWDNGAFNQETYNIYYDDYSQGWVIVFYNWYIPMTNFTALPNIKEYTLTCNVQTNSPNQTLQMSLYDVGYLTPQYGINFLPPTSNLPLLTGNPLTIP